MSRSTRVEGLRRLGYAFTQQVDLAVQCHDQTVDPFAPKDRVELRALYRQLADRAVEEDIGNLPRALVLMHQIVEGGRITVGFDNLGLDNDVRIVGPFAGDLQLLPRIAVEPVGVGRRDIVPERVDQLLLLSGRERCPGRAYGESGHGRDVKDPVDNGGQSRITTTLPESWAVSHCRQERVVKTAHTVLRIHRKRSCAPGEHADAQRKGERQAYDLPCPTRIWNQVTYGSTSSFPSSATLPGRLKG